MLEGARLTGLLLLGSVLGGLLVGLASPILGNVWTAPQDSALKVIAQHPRAWRTANVGFALATVLTAAGLWTLPDVVGDDGAALARAGAAAYALSSGLWLVALSFRMTVTPAVASAYVAGATVDPAYESLGGLMGGLFAAFTIIAGASLVAIGAAILLGGATPAVAGWATLAIGALILGGYLWFGDMLPAVVYFPSAIIGTALLLSAH